MFFVSDSRDRRDRDRFGRFDRGDRRERELSPRRDRFYDRDSRDYPDRGGDRAARDGIRGTFAVRQPVHGQMGEGDVDTTHQMFRLPSRRTIKCVPPSRGYYQPT